MLMIIVASIGGYFAFRGTSLAVLVLPILFLAMVGGSIDAHVGFDSARVLASGLAKVFGKAVFVCGATYAICHLIYRLRTGRAATPEQ